MAETDEEFLVTFRFDRFAPHDFVIGFGTDFRFRAERLDAYTRYFPQHPDEIRRFFQEKPLFFCLSFTFIEVKLRVNNTFYIYRVIKTLRPMKVNIFNDYRDTLPKESTLEEVVRIIREDAYVKERTERHRYYLSQGLDKAATIEKQSCFCFSVATLFQGGKTQKHIVGWTGIGMVDFDDLPADRVDALAEKARQDPHTLLDYKTTGGEGLRVLFLYIAVGAISNLTDAQQKLIYEEAFERANRYYQKLLGVKPDPKCKTCTQLSGVAHDPDVYYNPNAEKFIIDQNAVLMYEQERKANLKRLRKVVKLSQRKLAEEGVVFAPGSHNEYVMRMAYLFNAYGIPEDNAYIWLYDQYAADYDGDIYGIVQSCYKHTDEHGTLKLPHNHGSSSGEESRWATVTDIEQFLDTQVSVRFNVIRRQCEIMWKDTNGEFLPITDRDENTLWSRMQKTGVEVRLQDIRNVLHSEYVPLFHPFESYFASLPEWDGVDYIGQLARTVHVKGSQEQFVAYFRKWFVGILPTIFDPQVVNHEIMVFIGRQGNYKSTFFSLLLPPPLQSYFQVKMNSSHLNKDDMLTLCEKALVCLEEIDELRPSELNQLKALVTATNISERAAYARNKEHRPHIATFCGTVNNPHFLSDPTGNRRWLVMEVEDIDDPRQHPFNYTGIYSQAWALWKSGFQYWFDQDEIRALNMQNRHYEAPNPEEELLLTYYRPTFEGCQGAIFLKVSEILERINAGIRQPLSSTKLGMLLSKLGFTKGRYNNERGYLVIERTMEEIQATRKIAARDISGSRCHPEEPSDEGSR